MAKQFFKNLPDTSTPLTATRLNGLLDGDESQGNLVVDSIRSKNIFTGFHTGTYDSSTGAYNPSGNGISTNKIKVVSGESYYLTGVENGITIRILYWNDNTYVTSETMTTLSAGNTITPQGNYLAIQTGTSATYSNVQLEKGTSATTYSPYQNLDGQEMYSTSEVKIGTWIDGKPLYRTTVTVNSIDASNNYIDVSHGISNMSMPISVKGIAKITNVNQYRPLGCMFINTSGNLDPQYVFNVYAVTESAFTLCYGNWWKTRFDKAYITIEYTKTTD